MDCNNCDTHKAVARNDEFCNVCEFDYYKVFTSVWRPDYKGENPKQALADSIMSDYEHEAVIANFASNARI